MAKTDEEVGDNLILCLDNSPIKVIGSRSNILTGVRPNEHISGMEKGEQAKKPAVAHNVARSSIFSHCTGEHDAER